MINYKCFWRDVMAKIHESLTFTLEYDLVLPLAKVFVKGINQKQFTSG